MADDLSSVVEKAELAVASAAGVIDESSLRVLVQRLRAVRLRLLFPTDVVVAALAGGTGSGKSSLFNAILGEEVVDVGGVRPTTQRPAVGVPGSIGQRLDGYLDGLGIDQWFTHDLEGFALLDLPDIDSVAEEHRLRVDEVLPLVDVVVWVVDPEKYRDARMHHEYISPLSVYAEQFVFVLNQIDRLDDSETEAILEDLRLALQDDGIPDPMVLGVSAMPPAGPPVGLDRLIDLLGRLGSERAAVDRRLVEDLRETARALGDDLGQGVDFDSRAEAVLDSATSALVDHDPAAAVIVLTGFLDALAGEVETPTAFELHRVASRVPGHVRRIETEIEPPEPPRRWWKRQPAASPDAEAARRLLAEAVIRPARAHLARRALAAASITELALELESLR